MFVNRVTSIKIGEDENIINIDIFIEDLNELYASPNYSSQNRRSLNKELERYILNCASNHSLRSNIRLVFHVPMSEINREIYSIKEIIRNHFKYKATEAELNLMQKFRQWRLNLCIGMVFIATCFVLLELFSSKATTNVIKLLRESLLIMGWVALWEPITFILFGWEPILRKKFYYKKLSIAPISIHRYMNRSSRFMGSI